MSKVATIREASQRLGQNVFFRRHLGSTNSFNSEEWQNIGQKLEESRDSLLFWVGDWLKMALSELSKEKNVRLRKGFKSQEFTKDFYSEAVKSLGFDQSTLNAAKWVATRIQPELRFYHGDKNVTWSHYQQLAALGCEYEKESTEAIGQAANAIKMWVDWVIDNKSTVNELRLAIQATKAKSSKLLTNSKIGSGPQISAIAGGGAIRIATEEDEDHAESATGGQKSNLNLISEAIRALKAVNGFYDGRINQGLSAEEKHALMMDYAPLVDEFVIGANLYESLR